MGRGLSRLRAAVGVALVVAVVVGAAVAAGVLGAPSVAAVQNRFAGVSDETTTIRTDVVVSNPNPIGVSLGGVTVNYTVDLGGVRLASGTKEGVNVTSGNSTLIFRTAMANERIPDWWITHIRNGERSALAVHATVRSSTLGRSVSFDPVDREIETDLLSAFNSTETRPVNANQPLVSDPVLYVNETGAAWGAVSEVETPIRMRFVVYNPKAVPYTVTGVGYEIKMNDVAVGSGETDRAYAIPPRSSRMVRAVTAIDNQHLDEWWATHIERDQVTDLRIDFYARIELPGGQEVRVPLDPLTYTETMETDVFGTKGSSQPAGGGSTATPEDGETTADGETTPTEATATTTEPPPSPDPTPTATPTPTPTDTGGGLLP